MGAHFLLHHNLYSIHHSLCIAHHNLYSLSNSHHTLYSPHHSVITMRSPLVLCMLVLAPALVTIVRGSETEQQSSRKGKIYLVSTTTSTSTSICWIQFSTVNGIVTCAKKKRSIAFLEE